MNSRQEYVETCLAFHKDFKKKCDRFKFYYVKDEFGDRVGVVVVYKLKTATTKFIGASYCNPRDEFDRDIGLASAIGRSLPITVAKPMDFPRTVRELALGTLDREKRISAISTNAGSEETSNSGNDGQRKVGWLKSFLGRRVK